jgi:hypothetical protein
LSNGCVVRIVGIVAAVNRTNSDPIAGPRPRVLTPGERRTYDRGDESKTMRLAGVFDQLAEYLAKG